MKNTNTTPLKKRFYVLLALAVVAVLGSALTVRHMTRRLTRGLAEFATGAPSTAAQQELFDEPDPRDTQQMTMPTDPAPQTTQPKTTQPEATKPSAAAPTTTAPTTAKAAAAQPTQQPRLPLDNTKVIKDYAPTVPVFSKTMGDWRVHDGVDFAAAEGDPVKAVAAGVVTKVSSDSGWGYVIEVDHGDFTARYCALEQGTTVAIGTSVKQGDVLGTVAVAPNENADGCHLHFACRRAGMPTDPMEILATGSAGE